ncbi:MAG: MDR family MFS transporter [Bacillota bacterium]|nr:MDR family MFS transporter [Bacillota bacterium]
MRTPPLRDGAPFGGRPGRSCGEGSRRAGAAAWRTRKPQLAKVESRVYKAENPGVIAASARVQDGERRRGRAMVTVAVMVATFLTAMDMSIVNTAIPTIVGNLGGMELFSWLISAYLLTSATTVPIYGKLADLYGRKRVFVVATLLFLAGSALSGQAHSMEQLILYRALQGIGAGGVQPITATIIGDIFSLEERARMQGVFSSVWGVSAIIGPAAGGFIVDMINWRWIFYINLPLGLAAVFLVARYLVEPLHGERRPVDVGGPLTLSLAVVTLLLALTALSQGVPLASAQVWPLLLTALLGSAAFVWLEQRVPEPMLPFDLFRNRIVLVASLVGLVSGAAMTGMTTFVPMFVQGVQLGTAATAGSVVAPMSVGWPLGSILCGRLVLRTGYRAMVAAGTAVDLLASLLVLTLGPSTPLAFTVGVMVLMGLGLGFSATSLLIGVQSSVPWSRRGVATATNQFVRNLGSTVGVAVLGILLDAHLLRLLEPLVRAGRLPRGSDPVSDVNALLDPAQRLHLAPSHLQILRDALGAGLHSAYWGIVALGVAGFALALLTPGGDPSRYAVEEKRAGSERGAEGAEAQGAEAQEGRLVAPGGRSPATGEGR